MFKSIVLCVALTLASAACAESGRSASPAEKSKTSPASSQTAAFTRVTDASQVCMVNDRFMGTPQIPVQVEGRTYYGCCEMCEKRLKDDPNIRGATDPISKNKIDKALAVIAKDASGNILYFENERSLEQANRAL